MSSLVIFEKDTKQIIYSSYTLGVTFDGYFVDMVNLKQFHDYGYINENLFTIAAQKKYRIVDNTIILKPNIIFYCSNPYSVLINNDVNIEIRIGGVVPSDAIVSLNVVINDEFIIPLQVSDNICILPLRFEDCGRYKIEVKDEVFQPMEPIYIEVM